MVKSNTRCLRTQGGGARWHTPRALDALKPRENYVRARDLPRLIALWPNEIDDMSCVGSELIVQRLRRALRAERNRGRAGHWSYDLNRHLGLAQAYRAELERLESFSCRQPNRPTKPSGIA